MATRIEIYKGVNRTLVNAIIGVDVVSIDSTSSTTLPRVIVPMTTENSENAGLDVDEYIYSIELEIQADGVFEIMQISDSIKALIKTSGEINPDIIEYSESNIFELSENSGWGMVLTLDITSFE